MHRAKPKQGQRIIHNLSLPIMDRLEDRRRVSPYYVTPTQATTEERSFYLDSDFMPRLRWQWCDDITRAIKNRGWFCDDLQLDTIRGVVFRLPHNRGFLAGWAMGEGMFGGLSVYIWDNEIDAAHAANQEAERIAEVSRMYDGNYQESDSIY